ncbi:MAG: hypothetical protein HC772_06685 [Leptolyngbyaceae cyanobacterium CRU_2_3]|nr:hypothetical protein [Leptolyngbyaceae cyanobacterium CRU_2_3]
MTIENGEYLGAYDAINGSRSMNQAVDGTQMNMIMVSGIVPSRVGQSYGGLHNFPRFIEDWKPQKLYMSGAFLQLNFSTYATAPFDQDRFEVSTIPDGDPAIEAIPYYDPPDRIWGYDVGLQYTKAGPVAQRFKFAEAIRSEFYREPASDDPYIAKLKRCSTQSC